MHFRGLKCGYIHHIKMNSKKFSLKCRLEKCKDYPSRVICPSIKYRLKKCKDNLS